MDPKPSGVHPVRLVVGFHGGNPKSSTRRQATSRYTARGGRENTGSWWLETVELSDIYRRA
jgi:hypothetical protein